MRLKTTIALGGLFAFISYVYVARLGGDDNTLISNILFLLPPLLATVCAGFASHAYGLRNVHGRAFAYMCAGLLCLFIGEATFFILSFFLHIDPFPSIADVFYLAAYPLLFVGIIRELFFHRPRLRDFNKLVLLFIVLFSLVLAFLVSYFGVYSAYDASESLLYNYIAIGYGVGGLILIVPSLFVLKMALDYRGGRLYYSWTLFLIALIFLLVGDILFSIFEPQYSELIYPYTLIDLAWTACYLLFTFSFYYTGRTIQHLQTKIIKK
jgi:hypothetical protein